MTSSFGSFFFIALGLALGPSFAETAYAQTPSQVLPQQAPLTVTTRGDTLPADLLRTTLENELGRTVVLAADAAPSTERLTITWRRASGELAVSYESGVQNVTRVVTAADSAERVVSDASLLAANLLREDVAHREAPADPTPEPPSTPPARVEERADASPATPWRPAVASFAFPLATNYSQPWAGTHFEFNLLFGRIGALEGLQLGMFGLTLGAQGHPLATGDVRGAQVAVLGNVASGSVAGYQLAVGANVAAGGLTGLQTGAVNVAAGRVQGAQVGLVNVSAGKVEGLQLGLVNYAKEVDGVPLGLVSVTESGGIHPVAWASSSTYGNLGIKFATKYTYTMPYVSMHHAFDRALGGGGGAIGGRVPLGKYLRMEFDASFTYLRAFRDTPSALSEYPSYSEVLLQPRLRGALHVAPFKHFSLFAGGGAVGEVRMPRDDRDAELRVHPEVFGGLQL